MFKAVGGWVYVKGGGWVCASDEGQLLDLNCLDVSIERSPVHGGACKAMYTYAFDRTA